MCQVLYLKKISEMLKYFLSDLPKENATYDIKSRDRRIVF
jgi:hypothetical protein